MPMYGKGRICPRLLALSPGPNSPQIYRSSRHLSSSHRLHTSRFHNWILSSKTHHRRLVQLPPYRRKFWWRSCDMWRWMTHRPSVGWHWSASGWRTISSTSSISGDESVKIEYSASRECIMTLHATCMGNRSTRLRRDTLRFPRMGLWKFPRRCLHGAKCSSPFLEFGSQESTLVQSTTLGLVQHLHTRICRGTVQSIS